MEVRMPILLTAPNAACVGCREAEVCRRQGWHIAKTSRPGFVGPRLVQTHWIGLHKHAKPPMGFEPMTSRLLSGCSTNYAKEAPDECSNSR